jgi:NTP pyrophosphatase (non-canonical NTP hydrolase)
MKYITKEEADIAALVWGKERQTNMVIEELGEFLQAWNKVKRGAFTEEQYVEELVDVYIMIQQMIHMHSEVFAKVYPKKLAKVKAKIAKADKALLDDVSDVGC